MKHQPAYFCFCSVTSLQNSFSAVTVKEDFHEAKQADKQNSLLLDDGHKRSLSNIILASFHSFFYLHLSFLFDPVTFFL